MHLYLHTNKDKPIWSLCLVHYLGVWVGGCIGLRKDKEKGDMIKVVQPRLYGTPPQRVLSNVVVCTSLPPTSTVLRLGRLGLLVSNTDYDVHICVLHLPRSFLGSRVLL